MDFAKGEIIGGDVRVGTRETFFTYGELIHERETEIVLFGGKIDFEEAVGTLASCFPANLAAKA